MSASGPQPELHAAFALLAAGRGTRFGGGKLTADLAGRPLWRWAAESAVEAGLRHIHVVTNDAIVTRECEAAGWTAHPNPQADEGMASSVRIAASATAQFERMVLALADMPFIEPAHLRRLASAPGVAFSRQPDRRDGVPAAFPRESGPRLSQLSGNRGAASLAWPGAQSFSPALNESLFDVDTPEDLERAQAIALRLCQEVPR